MRLPIVLTAFVFLAATLFAAGIKLTIYDDGFSCPGNCDAHVVFHPSLNGTKHAHSRDSPAGRFDKCKLNTLCRICLDDRAQECMNVMYRGGGPPENTFDFTPAFYAQHCSEPSIPPTLAAKCNALRTDARQLDGRVNCIKNPEHPKCVQIIQTAKQSQAVDRPLYEQCKRDGQAKFNQTRPKAQRRDQDCAYEKHGTGGPNSRGVRWARLLPGVCRDNTYVGRDGLDCCSGAPLTDGAFGKFECKGFYPLP